MLMVKVDGQRDISSKDFEALDMWVVPEWERHLKQCKIDMLVLLSIEAIP